MQYLILGDWFTKGLKSISYLLDSIVYYLARIAFEVFCSISEVTLINGETVEEITRRVYVILGIAMVFILAYYLLNYIVDPDKVNDKSMGPSTFIKDIIIALVIITMTPTLFTKLYAFQHTIITSGVISRLVLGGTSDPNNTNIGLSKVKEGANQIVASTYSAFVTPNIVGFSSFDCHDSTLTGIKKQYCDAYNETIVDGKIDGFYPLIRDEQHFNYWPLLSTVGGIALTFFMLSFCLNLGKRVGKMAILQFLAPIPALLELVPGSKGTRKTWIDTLIKTYLEVFVFQAVIFIIIFLITLIPDVISEFFDKFFYGSDVLIKVFTLVFLIFGLLQFAKEAPKMIMDLLGIKGTGTISAGFKRGIAMAGVVGNAGASTLGNIIRGATENTGVGRIGGAVLGGGSALVRNLWAGRNAHTLADANKNRKLVNQEITTRRVDRQAYNFEHGGFMRGLRGRVSDAIGDINRQFKGATSISVGYEKKNTLEKTFSELSAKKKAILQLASNNSDIQTLRSQYLQAMASGNTKYAETIAEKIDGKFADIRRSNGFRVAIGEFNGVLGANQEIDYVSHKKLDADTLAAKDHKVFSFDRETGEVKIVDNEIDIKSKGVVVENGEEVMVTEMKVKDKNGKEITITGKGVTDILKNDIVYQTEKAERVINEKVKEQAQKKAQEKNEDKK